MFKADRVGTPDIHTNVKNALTGAMTLKEDDYNDEDTPVNIINSTPLLDLGRYKVTWNQTSAVATAKKIGLGCQFTVSQPIVGDTVGLEIIGSLQTLWPHKGTIIPAFGRLTESQALYAGVDYDGGATPHGQQNPYLNEDVVSIRANYFKTQFIINASSSLSGTYAFGWTLFNNSGSSHNLTWFEACFAIRQFNDLQDAAYRDPLR